MKVPSIIKVICYADGKPLEGALLLLTLHVSRKNDYTVISKLTQKDGSVVITWPEIERSANADRNFFVMDYTGLGEFTGNISIIPMNCMQIEAAVEGYNMYYEFGYGYEPGYIEKLQRAKQVLENIVPAQLSVEVEHDGEAIAIYAETAQA